MRRFLALVAMLSLGPLAFAVDSGQRFEDAAEQERYERLIRDLRCLVCQNESVADSNAQLASDLRREVETLMREGQSDVEIHAFMTERYGDFVLFRPPVAPRTWLLWAAPALFLAGGIAIVIVIVRRRVSVARANPEALDEEPDRQ